MNHTVLILLIVVGVIFIPTIPIVISAITSTKKLKSKLEKSFGIEPRNQDYEIGGINTYHDYMDNAANHLNLIDELTWDDLDMDRVFKRMNVCCSSVGEEYLYHILHTPCFNAEKLLKREKLISYLKSNDDQRLNLQMIFSKFGKKDYNGLLSFINNQEVKQLKCPCLYNVLALTPIIGIVMIPFLHSIGIWLLLISFAINIIVYYYVEKNFDFEPVTLEYFSFMLQCCNKICKIKNVQLKPYICDLENNFKIFKPLISKIPTLSKKIFSDLEVILEYVKILFLSDIRNYNKIMKSIRKNNAYFEQLYKCVGELDASISILSFRESLPFYCTPEFRSENIINFRELYHPLLSAPVANDAVIHNNCIITGSNASGKSTFIKAIAVNGILAQTINTCSAYSYSSRFALVITSMAVRDNITEGDSYFITEIKSLKRILDKSDKTPCMCFIDEILKGTNTIERIASSAAVLKYLQGKDCLCMVASHDIELTEILKNQYDCYHFSEQITDYGIHFDYLLKKGASQTRNAIKLLHYMNFDADLVEEAENLVEKFTVTKKW